MVKLTDIVDIRSGYNFREGIPEAENGNLQVIQFKDLSGLILEDNPNRLLVLKEQIKTNHWLNFNDILLSNRGNYKSAVNRCEKPCIASGVFFVLTVKDNKFLPEYIAIFLNSVEGQKALSARQNSAGVSSIIRSELTQIDIPFIPLEKQKQVVELFQLYEKEVDTMEKIKQNRKKLINSILSQAVKE